MALTSHDFTAARQQHTGELRLTDAERNEIDEVKRILHVVAALHQIPAGLDTMIERSFRMYEQYVK